MSINWLFTCDDPTIILSKAKNILKSNYECRKKIHKSNDINYILSVLIHDFNILESFSQLTCVMKYVYPSQSIRNIWNNVDTLFKNYYN